MKRKKIKSNFRYVIFVLISFFLIPLIYSLIGNFPYLFSDYQKITGNMIYSLLGFVFFTIFYFIIGQPVRSYIIAHELSHIIFAFLTGIKVSRVSFKTDNSFVKTKGSNILISLGPYILPLYSIITILIYKVILIFVNYSMLLALIFYFISGAGYSFHILSTVHYLKYDQPDMKRYGYFFSLTFVIVWVIIISAFLFSLMFSKVKLILYLLKVLKETRNIYKLFFKPLL